MGQEPRTLSYIPILHTGADMGRLEGALTGAAAARLGEEAWQRHRLEVKRLWDATEQAVLQLDLDFGAALIYQDGLPVCGREAAIVDELAAAGSRNHQLLQRLRARGTILMGTESPELLVEEYELTRQMLAAGEAPQRSLAANLLARRDRFIAERIASTLPPGRHALLFIGALHDVWRWLPGDVEVRYPIGRPRWAGQS